MHRSRSWAGLLLIDEVDMVSSFRLDYFVQGLIGTIRTSVIYAPGSVTVFPSSTHFGYGTAADHPSPNATSHFAMHRHCKKRRLLRAQRRV